MTESEFKMEEYKTIDKYENTIITRITVAENGDMQIKEGVVNSIYLDGVSWHHEIVFTGEKLELLKKMLK